MFRIGQNEEEILEHAQKVLLEESIADSDVCACEVVDELEKDGQTDVCDVAHCVPKTPHKRVHCKLELLLVQLEQSWETVHVDSTHKAEKALSMLGVFSKVLYQCNISAQQQRQSEEAMIYLVDHIQSRLEDGVKHGRHAVNDVRLSLEWTSAQAARSRRQRKNTHADFVDDRCHNIEYFGIPGCWDVAVIIAEHRFQESYIRTQ